MKLAIVDPSFHWPPTGGSWVDLREISTRLVRHGIDLKMFTVRFDDAFIQRGLIKTDPGFPVTAIPVSPEKKEWPARLKKEVDEFAPDAVLIGNTFSNGPALIETFRDYPVYIRIYGYEIVCPNVMSVRRNRRVSEWWKPVDEPVCPRSYLENPWTCTLCALRTFAKLVHPRRSRREPMHPLASEYFQHRAYLPGFHRLNRRSLDNVKAILVYNAFIAEKFKTCKTTVQVTPGGVDTDHFSPGTDPPEPGMIFMPGRVQDPRKGFPVFKKAIEIIAETGREFNVKVTDPMAVGQSPRIESTGWVSFQDMPELYRSAYLCVIPTDWPEPFGLVTLEAMACGTPVITSDIGGFQQTVSQDETGIRVPRGDSHALAAAIISVLDDPEKRNRMGRAARERACTHFTWDRTVEKYYLPLFTSY